MGWWGYNLFAAGSYHATTPDEVEYMAARVRAWDASPNFETSTTGVLSRVPSPFFACRSTARLVMPPDSAWLF